MIWTRMKDHLGGYHSAQQCFGQKISIRVWHNPGNNRWPWTVQIDGLTVDVCRTCREAKDSADDYARQWRARLVEERNNKVSV